MFELIDNIPQSAVIKVLGVGGGGGNAVHHMITNQVDGVDFICANTDSQALNNLKAKTILQMGTSITKGLGAGANPEIGRQAALEDRDQIADILSGADMVFITAGMGGGTGTGAAPIVAEVARELGILTVAVVTRPFPFEGKKRSAIAEQGIEQLSANVDSLITIPNEKLLDVLGKEASLLDAFKAANDVLLGAVKGIADLIMHPGMINVDFADVKTVMSEMGMAMMGTGFATGEDRAREAAESAIRSPLLEDVNLQGARGILVNITAGETLSLGEFSEVGDTIEEFASDDATVVVGTVIDPELGDEMRVTVVATGLGGGQGKPKKIVDNTQREQTDYSKLDRPAVLRNRPVDRGAVVAQAVGAEADIDYLDIPAFLRKQADLALRQQIGCPGIGIKDEPLLWLIFDPAPAPALALLQRLLVESLGWTASAV